MTHLAIIAQFLPIEYQRIASVEGEFFAQGGF